MNDDDRNTYEGYIAVRTARAIEIRKVHKADVQCDRAVRAVRDHEDTPGIIESYVTSNFGTMPYSRNFQEAR